MDPGSTRPPIDGIVLAAGRSRRMGQSKPLLRIRGGRERHTPAAHTPAAERDPGATFLECAVRRLTDAGCRSVSVVVAAGDDPVRRHARALGASVVENPEPESLPIDSVRLALASLPVDAAAAMVLPVDVPLVTTETVAALIEAFAARGAPIVAPSHRGVLGHPVLIARALFEAIMVEPLAQGLRSMIESRREEVEAVHVDDPGALVDIDTPEDYDELALGSP